MMSEGLSVDKTEQEFINSLEALLRNECDFTPDTSWLPASAQAVYLSLQKQRIEENKIVIIKRALKLFADWSQTLRILLLRDLATFVKANAAEFSGDENKWMEQNLIAIWRSVFNENLYHYWLATGCDGIDFGPAWYAPLWFAELVNGKAADSRKIIESEFFEEPRLSENCTETLVHTLFLKREAGGRFVLNPQELKEIDQLYVSVRQGVELLPGLARRQMSLLQNQPTASSTTASAGDNATPDVKPSHPDLTNIQRQGARCYQIKIEMRQIRYHYVQEGRSMAEIRSEHPQFEIWKFVKELPEEYQRVFESPSRWEATVGYARLLLSKKYNRDITTIRDWEKSYRRYERSLMASPQNIDDV
jgi:hypothetical protein